MSSKNTHDMHGIHDIHYMYNQDVFKYSLFINNDTRNYTDYRGRYNNASLINNYL